MKLKNNLENGGKKNFIWDQNERGQRTKKIKEY